MITLNDIIALLRHRPNAISEAEEKIYELVAAEIAAKRMRPGVYAKAFAEAGGNQSKATAIYIAYRVEQVKKEIENAIQSMISEQAAAEVRAKQEEEAEKKKSDASGS